ncbi:MAG: chitin binding protein [Eubacterium sp.]|jgi:hypothetical protein|nr:chitin binding protein [Eubacterium sp.]
MKNIFGRFGIFKLVVCILISIIINIIPFTFLAAAAADSKEVVLFDDFNREELGVTGDGGAYNAPNSAGIAIYWIQMANTKAQIENNALKISMDKNGWYGEGVAFKDPQYKYIIMKVKGEKGGEEKLLSINPDAKGSKKFFELKGPEGKPVPKVTKEYQTMVIDIKQSGLDLPNGFEAIHFNNAAPLTVYIDEIYLSKTGVPVELKEYFAVAEQPVSNAGASTASGSNAKGSTAGVSTVSGSTTSVLTAGDSASGAATGDASAAVTSAAGTVTGNTAVNNSNSGAAGSKVIRISIIIAIMAVLIAGVVYNSFIRKSDAC